MSRRLAREVALRSLFQMESGRVQLDDAMAFSLDTVPLPEELQSFARQLVDNALTEQQQSDQIISDKARDWDIDRLARVDRAILRLALGEFLSHTGVPAGVIINEAVELANKYSTAESGKFINGILGSVARSTGNG